MLKKIRWLVAECLDGQIEQTGILIMITLVTIVLFITILQHIQNPGIFNA